MNKYKIESGVPIPPAANNSPRKYPWEDMKHGDSFFEPTRPGETPDAARNRVRAAAAGYLRRSGRPFRAVSRAVEGGARLWFLDL